MHLCDLSDDTGLSARLAAGRLSAAAVARQTALFARVAAHLRADGHPPGAPAHAFFVPGRIEVLGKHTDYAGGRSLTGAVERGFAVAAVPGTERAVRLDALDAGAATFDLDPDLPPRPGHWSDYGRTVARRVAMNFPGALRGGHLAFAGDLPAAAGLSSSSALIVGVFLALAAINDLESTSRFRAHLAPCLARAHYLGCVENGQSFGPLAGSRGVGTFGGSEDHTAILCSVPEALRCYRYAPARLEHTVPVPPGYVFAVGASGVTAHKAGAARTRYNRAAQRAAEAAEAWRAATGRTDPHLAAAVASPGFTPEAMHRALAAGAEAGVLRARFDAFYAEHAEIVPAAVRALADGDLAAFGALAARSQEEVAERGLGNQVAETSLLVRAARDAGAVAASAFGAGFGGSVWALVEEAGASSFLSAWEERYAAAYPQHPSAFFTTPAGPPAFSLADASGPPA